MCPLDCPSIQGRRYQPCLRGDERSARPGQGLRDACGGSGPKLPLTASRVAAGPRRVRRAGGNASSTVDGQHLSQVGLQFSRGRAVLTPSSSNSRRGPPRRLLLPGMRRLRRSVSMPRLRPTPGRARRAAQARNIAMKLALASTLVVVAGLLLAAPRCPTSARGAGLRQADPDDRRAAPRRVRALASTACG